MKHSALFTDAARATVDHAELAGSLPADDADRIREAIEDMHRDDTVDDGLEGVEICCD